MNTLDWSGWTIWPTGLRLNKTEANIHHKNVGKSVFYPETLFFPQMRLLLNIIRLFIYVFMLRYADLFFAFLIRVRFFFRFKKFGVWVGNLVHCFFLMRKSLMFDPNWSTLEVLCMKRTVSQILCMTYSINLSVRVKGTRFINYEL